MTFQHTWWDGWMFDATVDQLVWHQQPASPSQVDPVSIEWEFVGIIVHRCSHDIWYLSLSSASSVSHITMIRGMSSFGCGTLPCSSFDQTRSPPTLTCVMKFLWHVNNDDDDQIWKVQPQRLQCWSTESQPCWPRRTPADRVHNNDEYDDDDDVEDDGDDGGWGYHETGKDLILQSPSVSLRGWSQHLNIIHYIIYHLNIIHYDIYHF